MRVDAIEIRRVRLPLVEPLRASYGTEAARDTLVLRLEGDAGEGWGECVALAEPRYAPEHVDGALLVLRDHLLPDLLAAGDVTASTVTAALAGVRGHPMAKAAVEMAVLDAELRAAGRSLARHLGATRAAVAAGVAVGLAGSVAELLDRVDRFLAEGYGRVKLKIQPGWDVEPVAAVRDHVGDGVLLQVDANGAYRLADAADLARLDRFDLVLLEQPLADDDLLGHAELSRRLATPVCLDESIGSLSDAATALALGACSIVNIKPARVGGLLEARRIHDLCLARGVPVWCGGMLESGLGRAANLALAALPGFTLPGDLPAPGRWFGQDITDPVPLVDGHLAVPDRPGIGAAPRPDALDDLTVAVDVVSRRR